MFIHSKLGLTVCSLQGAHVTCGVLGRGAASGPDAAADYSALSISALPSWPRDYWNNDRWAKNEVKISMLMYTLMVGRGQFCSSRCTSGFPTSLALLTHEDVPVLCGGDHWPRKNKRQQQRAGGRGWVPGCASLPRVWISKTSSLREQKKPWVWGTWLEKQVMNKKAASLPLGPQDISLMRGKENRGKISEGGEIRGSSNGNPGYCLLGRFVGS